MILSNQYIKYNSREIDLLKFVLAIFVVGLHTLSVDFIGRPILRFGVPIFFIISSYLFFLKQGSCDSATERRQALMRYVKRVLKLYLFWLVVLLPITIYSNKWHVNLGFDTIVVVVRNFFFSYTFAGSWFLMALIIGMSVVWFLGEKKVRDFWIILIGIVLYLLCCMSSTYQDLVAKVPSLAEALNNYEKVFTEPHNSFPAGILFIAMGKILAQRKFHVSNKVLVITTGLLFALIYCEHFMLRSISKIMSNDSYLMLPPLCLCLFMLVGQNTKFKLTFDTRHLRAYSTIIYCSHMSIAFCLYGVLRYFVVYESTAYHLIAFPTTLALSLLLSYVILKLERRKGCALLKYSH